MRKEDSILSVKRKFRTAYALKPGFRFGALRPYCTNIVYATDGFYTELEKIASQLKDSLDYFDPEKDCIVPVGNAIVNLFAGIILGIRFPESVISVAIFTRDANIRDSEDYVFYDVPINSVFNQVPRKEDMYASDPSKWQP